MKISKKVIVLLIPIIALILTTVSLVNLGTKDENKQTNTDAIRFKEEYESLNNQSTGYGNNNRNVTIKEDNMIVYSTASEVLEMIEDKKSFYVYFGSNKCPWCRSVIEKALEMAEENGATKIYYVDIWDEEGNEILRDKYILNDDGTLKQSIKGTDEYYQLLEVFDEYLEDYILTDSKGKEISTGEKRIFAPNYIYVSNGEATALVTGISEHQKGAYDKLTKEILEDEEATFSKFFVTHSMCIDTLC